MNHSETVNFIWSIANLIRDTFRRSKYPIVILPFTVLRRIDCVLAPGKQAVLEAHRCFKGRIAPEMLEASFRVNPPENTRLMFERYAGEMVQK